MNRIHPLLASLMACSPLLVAQTPRVNAPVAPEAILPWLPKAEHSGKGQLKTSTNGLVTSHSPMFLVVAHADVGKVDLIDLYGGQRIRTVDVSGVQSLCHYWRQ